MLMRICAVCGRKVEQGKRCPCQKQRHKAYDREHRDKSKAAFYNSPGWKYLARAKRRMASYTDEYVEAVDRKLKPGKIVHHIIPLSDDMSLALDVGNLICVSEATHNYIHREYEKGEDAKRQMQAKLFSIVRGRGAAL